MSILVQEMSIEVQELSIEVQGMSIEEMVGIIRNQNDWADTIGNSSKNSSYHLKERW